MTFTSLPHHLQTICVPSVELHIVCGRADHRTLRVARGGRCQRQPFMPTTPWLVLLIAPFTAVPAVLFTAASHCAGCRTSYPARPYFPRRSQPRPRCYSPNPPLRLTALRHVSLPMLPPRAMPEPAMFALSSAAAESEFCAGGASAWIAPLNASSWPPFSTALSKTTPSFDSVLSLLLACASVTCPTSFDPLCSTTLPSDFTS